MSMRYNGRVVSAECVTETEERERQVTVSRISVIEIRCTKIFIVTDIEP